MTGSSWLSTGSDAAGRVTVAGYTMIGDKSLGPDYAVQCFSTGGALLNSYGSPVGALGWDADWNPLFSKTYVAHYIDVSETVVLGSGCIYVGGWGFDSMTGEGASLVLVKYAR